ncbi:MAG: low-specificity L-threonine aldolase [Pseudomonadota bacterium]
MYASASESTTAQTAIDLRSDTVTRPSAAMREAMASAPVGDDVYGDDPTVKALEERAAHLLGKEAGLFVSSGTQSNLVALLSHCGRGDEYIGGKGYHIPKYEAAGAAVLGGISPNHLALNETGGLNADDVEAAIQPDDPHFAVSRLLCLENTFNGQVMDQDGLEAAAAVAHANGLAVHLDGARLMNAAVKSNRAAAHLVACADTVSLCLSKGLGAPVGSVLTGPKDFIAKARRMRKLVGGGLRQSGVLAACALYALENNVERLREDHDRAHRLAARLAALDGISIDLSTVHTNMIWLRLDRLAGTPVSDHFANRGLVVADPSGKDNLMRVVLHLDIEESHLDQIVEAFETYLATVPA